MNTHFVRKGRRKEGEKGKNIPMTHSAFTLVELLVVSAIISLLAAILFPSFAQAREKSRQTSCLSNVRQVGLSIAMYRADYDEQFPHGLGIAAGERLWAGEGWAGQCQPYAKNPGVFSCPTDTQTLPGAGNFRVSYGYNINLLAFPGDWDEKYHPPPGGISEARLNSAARTILLFEVSGVFANISDPTEGAANGKSGRHYSASANGLDNRLYAQKDWSTRTENQYATGYLGGRIPPDPDVTQFASPRGRHSEGSNFLLCDGHAKWSLGAKISSGLNASHPACSQDNLPPVAHCADRFRAAGTESAGMDATFSIR
jgi:prepilin-type N-terminal cleavage/methylation domain-containing protein/prepilin-type processing-associated H-X9-DG protein